MCFQCSNRGKALAVETDHGSRKRKDVPRRSRGSSSGGGFDRDKFIDRDHAERYRVIDNWRFISERRVELRDGECPEFTQMLTRRNWRPLASLPEKFDPYIVKEFYANAYGGKDSKSREKVSVVRGTRVPYTADWINEKIGNSIISPISSFQRNEVVMDDYARMRSQGEFDLESTLAKICYENRRIAETSHTGVPHKVLRVNMTMISKL